MRYILFVILSWVAPICMAGENFFFIKESIPPNSSRSWMQPVSTTALPITVIHGASPGPVLTLTAGIHGDEFPAIFALQQLRQLVQPEQLHGTLIIIHLANLEGFHARRIALSPVDEKNLNRVFPGRDDGTLTEQIANFITHEIIGKTDYLIDIHSGSWHQALLPHVYSPVIHDNKLDDKTLAFAKSLRIPHIVLYDERPHDPAHSISYPNTAQTRGKPALTLEVGELGQFKQQHIDAIEQAVLNAMRYLKMSDQPNVMGQESMDTDTMLYRKLVGVKSPETGIFKPLAQVGNNVKQGQAIGQICNYFGNAITTLYAPVSGTVLIQTQTPAIRKGESAIEIGLPR